MLCEDAPRLGASPPGKNGELLEITLASRGFVLEEFFQITQSPFCLLFQGLGLGHPQ